MAGIDDLDEALLKLLKKDARASFVDLAKGLGTSEGTVRARLKKLTENGVIRSFTIRTTGLGVRALVSVNVAANVRTQNVSKAIAELDGVTDVWEVAGEEDILARVDVATTEELDDVVERIRNLPEVRHTMSRLILREL